jgi:hypothetical protein
MTMQRVAMMLALTILGLARVQSASAAQTLYDGSGFLTGQQSFVQAFSVSGPGTLTVTLTNVAWPQELASLNLVMGTSSGLLGPEMSAGTETFNIGAGGTIFAQWFGQAQGPLDVGVYSMKISFQSADVTAVPLPGSLILLLSGLALLVWHRRHGHSLPVPIPA